MDTKYYCRAFEQFAQIPLRDLFRADIFADAKNTWTINFEPGYRLLNKLLAVLFDNPQTITVINGLLVFWFLFCFIRGQSRDCMLSIWLYVTLGVYQTDMNVTRNAIAIFICYCGVPLIREGRLLRYIAVVLAASLIHQTALLFLPLYFLIRYVKIDWKRALIIISVCMLLGLNTSIFRRQLMDLLPPRYARYFISETDNVAAFLVGLFNLIMVGLAYSFLMPEERARFSQNRENTEGIWMLILNLSFFAMSIGFFAWARVAALFGPYQVAFIPNILGFCDDRKRQNAGTAVIGGICFIQYVLRMLINNIGGTLPYMFFWQ